MFGFYDIEGRPITREEWADLIDCQFYRFLKNDVIGDFRVSTVWVGLDYSMSARRGHKILIFETMVFRGSEGLYFERAGTTAEAFKVHEKMRRKILKGTFPTEED